MIPPGDPRRLKKAEEVSIEGGIQGLSRLIARPSGNGNKALLPYQEKLAAVNGPDARLGAARDDELRERARTIRQRVTANAADEPAAGELVQFYNLDLLKVPANRPCIRVDHPDHIFPTGEARRLALLAEIKQVYQAGRPILVGTTSVAASESLAADLSAAGIPNKVLNARRDD